MLIGKRKSVWLNVGLFILTIFSTFLVGLSWGTSFELAEDLAVLPASEIDFNLWLNSKVFWLSGLYVFVLMTILVGHELGHYLTCRRYQLEATLPYFIPAPTLVGTLGAFIRIRSPITRKSQLFDIGLAGPLTGFFLSVPALVYGVANSKLVPSLPQEGTIYFGEPLLLKGVEKLLFGTISNDYDLVLHPVGIAGWVGILITAFNLFPVGQLDGGHIAYALLGARSRKLGRFVLGLFIIMGLFLWVGWLVWAALIFVLGLKHPQVTDELEKLSPGRRILGWVAVAIFILSFIPDPIKGYSFLDIIRARR
ncbi:MAG: site-2 protease family protein [Candidatus Aminicenantes bacterium]|nr:site-2 protease family protein [Candidatus Aminicenantes bacterium]